MLGIRFIEVREQLFLTQEELADKLGISARNVQRIEGLQYAEISKTTFRNLAALVGATLDGLKARIGATASEIQSVVKGDKIPKEQVLIKVEDEPSNVPGPKQKLYEIPLFDLSLAAGDWAEVGTEGEIHDPKSMEQGLFRVRIAGESMEKRYRNGAIIEFRRLRVDYESPIPGEDYYFQQDNGTATFKRLKAVDEEFYYLIPLNKKCKAMKVKKGLIVCCAEAVGEHRPKKDLPE